MLRSVLGAVAIVVSMALAGCSFSPVYSDGSPINAMSLAFDLGKPNSRLEQVVYQELALRFAVSTAPRTPKLTVSTSSSSQDVMMSNNNPPPSSGVSRDAQRITVSATATATYNGKTIFTATRQASADYYTSGQVLADNGARSDAEERAAKAAAESLRLAILATFPKSESYLD